MKLLFKNFSRLTKEEHKQILTLRNSDKIRNNMKTSEIILEDKHLEWIESLKDDKSKFYVAIVLFNKIIGSINIVNIKNESAHLGLYFSKDVNPLYSSLATLIFIEHVFKIYSLQKLIGEVLQTNKEALRFDKLLGFEDEGELYEGDKKYTLLKLTKIKWHRHKITKLYALTKKIDTITYSFI